MRIHGYMSDRRSLRIVYIPGWRNERCNARAFSIGWVGGCAVFANATRNGEVISRYGHRPVKEGKFAPSFFGIIPQGRNAIRRVSLFEFYRNKISVGDGESF